jgi:hypothetical protein
MKRVVLPTVVIFCLLAVMHSEAVADPVPDGLAGVPWGATGEQAQTIMAEKGFRQEEVDPLTGEPSPGLVFSGRFAGRMCRLRLYFKGNGFYSGEVVEKADVLRPVLEAYNYFITLLAEKYGAPEERNSIKNNDGSCTTYYAAWKLRDGVSSDTRYSLRPRVQYMKCLPAGKYSPSY